MAKVYQICVKYYKVDREYDETIDSYEFESAFDICVFEKYGFEFFYEYGGAAYENLVAAIDARDEFVKKLESALIEDGVDFDHIWKTENSNELQIRAYDGCFERYFFVAIEPLEVP